MQEAPMIPEEAVQAAKSAVKRGIAEVYHSGGVERIEFEAAPFVAWLAEIRADERRKVAEEIAAALDEKSLTVQQEAKEFAALENVAAKLLARAGALANAAVIAREIGEARDPR